MNNKGLTLIELIAVLIVLSLIALIVTPNIMVSIKEYQQQLYDTEMVALESAAKNWTADNINLIATESDDAIAVTIDELIDGGYYKSDAVDPKGGTFDDLNHYTFVIIKCSVIEDKYHVVETNYKYDYEAYTTKAEYLKAKAKEYLKNYLDSGNVSNSDFSNSVYTKDITTSDLISSKLISTNIYINGNKTTKLTLPSATMTGKITKKGKNTITYEYNITNYSET